MQKVLVTGGAGFIGFHLCKSLLDDGLHVVCLDNLITGNKKNIEVLLSNPNFEFFEEDVCNLKPNDPRFTQCNLVFHLASPASPIDYQNLPKETLLTNSIGTLNVLNLAKDINAKVLVASTSEIYGDPLEHPQKETYWGNANSFGPRSCYDESKRFAEAASYVYLHSYDMDIRIIRIFNTYGPKMQKDDGRVVSNFIMAAITGGPLRIDGDGSQTRSFCYVDDFIEALIRAMFYPDTNGQVFNLGSEESITMLQLASMISSNIKIAEDTRSGEQKHRKPDINKAKTILDWQPKISLKEGLEEMWKSFR